MKKIKVVFVGKQSLVGETFAKMRENGIPFIDFSHWDDGSQNVNSSRQMVYYMSSRRYFPITIREADYEMVKLISIVEVKVHDE